MFTYIRDSKMTRHTLQFTAPNYVKNCGFGFLPTELHFIPYAKMYVNVDFLLTCTYTEPATIMENVKASY